MEQIALFPLKFSIQEDSNEYKFDYSSTPSLPIGSVLVDFLNLDIPWLSRVIKKNNDPDESKFMNNLHFFLAKKYNLIFATLIRNFLVESVNYIISGGKLEDLYGDDQLLLLKLGKANFPNIDQSFNAIIMDMIPFLTLHKLHYKNLYNEMVQYDSTYKFVITNKEFFKMQNIGYSINSEIFDKKVVMKECFYLKDYQSFLAVEFMQVYKRKTLLKQCKNCGDWFIPVNRNDEIYCNKKNSNGRSCKQIGWENKPKDEAYNVYRKAYSRVFNYVKRHKGEYQELEDFFKVWKREANYYMSLCNGDNNRINQYKSWIRQSEKNLKKIVKSDEFTIEELKEWMKNNKGDNE